MHKNKTIGGVCMYIGNSWDSIALTYGTLDTIIKRGKLAFVAIFISFRTDAVIIEMTNACSQHPWFHNGQ